MDLLSSEDIEQLISGCLEQQKAISDLMADLDARLTSITQLYAWDSFSHRQRAALSRLHGTLRNARDHFHTVHV